MVQRCRGELGQHRPLTCCCQSSCGGINDSWLVKEVMSVKSNTFEHSTQTLKILVGVESNYLKQVIVSPSLVEFIFCEH